VTFAELLVTFTDPRFGLGFHCVLLAIFIVDSSRSDEVKDRHFMITMAFAPLIRILSLAMPLTHFDTEYWYLLTSIPLFVAIVLTTRALSFKWRELGMTLRGIPLQLLVALTGFGFGAVEYYILQPAALAPALRFVYAWWPALILVVSTGLLEELIFRGLLQRTGEDVLGRWGMPYVAALFAVLHIGYRSLSDVVFVFVVGLFLGWVVQRTRSLVGVTLAHGLTNTMLFLIMPFLVGG
jgi:membrane protease YdiL (CAAX protease family)